MTIPETLPPAFAAFGAFRQFIVWSRVPNPAGGKPDKVPVSPKTGLPGNPHDPAHQLSFDEARAYATALGMNVGFVFTDLDPFFFVDVDAAAVEGGWSETAQWVFQHFPGAAFELSTTGTGFHLFGSAPGPVPDHRKKRIDLHLELYTSLRFVALTFNQTQGDAATQLGPQLGSFIAQVMPPDPMADLSEDWREGPVPGSNPIVDDAALIERLCQPSIRLGTKAQFVDFWQPNIEALAASFPPQDPAKSFDGSSADLSMASALAFWTGKDHARIERIMRASGLYGERAWKWDARPDYLRETILRAVATCTDVYGAEHVEPAPAVPVPGPAVAKAPGYQYVAPDQLGSYFEGCVYVVEKKRVFVPAGYFLDSEQFRVHMGRHDFAMDHEGSKPTDNAFKALTESKAWLGPRPQVWGTLFRPQDPPGTRYGPLGQIDPGGEFAVNSYTVPPDVLALEGDVSPFLGLLEMQLPDPVDRERLLCWLAACVQYPGVKFQWAPVLQACEGNGKTFIAEALTRALGRQYVHVADPKDIDNRFNAWFENKLLIVVEEIHSLRGEIIEAIKPMITNVDMQLQGKGGDQIMGENRGNYLLLTNYQDAVRKTSTDRRFGIFFMAQQTDADLRACGMGEGSPYFPRLYEWLRKEGFAYITQFLRTYKIREEFNPATLAHRAPTTTSTKLAIEASRSPIEEAISEAIDQERTGFRGGWISSKWVNLLVEHIRGSGPRQNARALRELGYEPHPGLDNGRSPVRIPIDDGVKSRLWIRRDSLQKNIKAEHVVEAYSKAQTDSATAPNAAEVIHAVDRA